MEEYCMEDVSVNKDNDTQTPISSENLEKQDCAINADPNAYPNYDGAELLTDLLVDEEKEFLSTIKTDECALITSLVARRIVMPLVKLANFLGLSANTVTVIGGFSWVLSLFTIVAAAQLFVSKHHIYSGVLLLFTAFLWVWGYLLDVVDGSLARYHKTSSRRGFYLDYVFHLLFKPGFVVSIGVALSILNSSYSWLYFAILALAANWTCAESSSEHVLCEEVGKGRLNPAELSEETRTKVFLGTTDIKASAEGKKVSFWKMLYTLAKEILNYYGQSVFFALLAIIDLLIMIISYMFVDGGPFVWNWKLVTIAYFVLFTILILRVPFRIVREYKRMALLDKKENE
jgi:phosphatidylglycerophosphate synthase